MPGYILLGLALLLGIVLFLHWFVRADPKVLARALVWTATLLLGAGFLYLAVTGRLSWFFMAVPALLPWFLRMRSLARMAKTMHRMSQSWRGRGATGQTSAVDSRFLSMTLDHDTGEVEGAVREGAHVGRRLSELARAELFALLASYRADDAPSAQLLEAFLDRAHPGWREADVAGVGARAKAESVGGAFVASMTRDEAYRILGLEPSASDDDIKAAHRRLMAALHPDKGGSDYLAAKINQARDTLTS